MPAADHPADRHRGRVRNAKEPVAAAHVRDPGVIRTLSHRSGGLQVPVTEPSCRNDAQGDGDCGCDGERDGIERLGRRERHVVEQRQDTRASRRLEINDADRSTTSDQTTTRVDHRRRGAGSDREHERADAECDERDGHDVEPGTEHGVEREVDPLALRAEPRAHRREETGGHDRRARQASGARRTSSLGESSA